MVPYRLSGRIDIIAKGLLGNSECYFVNTSNTHSDFASVCATFGKFIIHFLLKLKGDLSPWFCVTKFRLNATFRDKDLSRERFRVYNIRKLKLILNRFGNPKRPRNIRNTYSNYSFAGAFYRPWLGPAPMIPRCFPYRPLQVHVEASGLRC